MTDDVMSQILDELEDSPDDGLIELIDRMIELEDRVKSLEEELKAEEADLRLLSQEAIPSKMDELQLTEASLQDGTKVTVSQKVKASIPTDPDKRSEALSWLRDNGHGSLIKNEVTASFGRGEDEMAEELLKELTEKEFSVSKKQDVHYQTLNAFVNEQLREAQNIPLDLFNAFTYRQTKITRKKE